MLFQCGRSAADYRLAPCLSKYRRKIVRRLAIVILLATVNLAACGIALAQDQEAVDTQSDIPKIVAPDSDPTANAVLMYALGLSGVRYKYGGLKPEAGFDCSGFVSHVFHATTGLVLPRSAWGMSKQGLHVEKNELRAGDLVFYNTLKRSFSHVGIYLGDGRFVHAPSRGKHVEVVVMTDSYWAKRYNGARRVIMAKGDE